ncbi:MAG TPA: Calx-beta domain-containing protein, partial [Pyrinomonadaceae bacterium]
MPRTPLEVTAPARRRLPTLALFAGLCLAFVAGSARVASAQPATGSRDLVISQVYTRGGEPGATFRNDFVEIFNRGNVPVNLGDYSLQVLVNAPPSPGFPGGLVSVSIVVVSSGSTLNLDPGKYYLYQFAGSGNNGATLPTPDTGGGSFPSDLNLPSTTGRVAIVKGLAMHPYTQYGCAVGVDAALADFFSYGATTCVEGGANFPAPSQTTAAVRNTDGCDDTENNVADFTTAAPNPRNTSTPQRLCTFPAATGTVQFAVSAASVSEGAGFAEILVTRAGATGPTSVQYATAGSAQFGAGSVSSERDDFTTTLGTLDFAAGETSKSFRVLVTDDALPEPGSTLTLALNYPTNGVVLDTRHIMRLTINDNDATSGANPIDTTDFFVRQHYADFLSRVPDETGRLFWTNDIDICGADAQCREVKRVNVSAAFFLSIEFQDTGYFAYRAYKAAFPGSPSRLRGFPLYRELWRDAQQIGRDVVVGRTGWEAQLAANKQAYAAEFVTRPEFLLRYPASQTPAQFVDALNATALNPLSQDERDQAVADLTAAGNTPAGRAAVLTRVVEDADFKNAELNRAFVLMQYFGYLRRDPDADGYNFWLGKLDEFNGDYIRAEMV